MKRTVLAVVVGLTLSLFNASAAFALDSSIVNNIRRANTSRELASVAEQIVRNEASIRPNNFEEGTQIAAETSAYLLYIQVKQNALILEKMSTAGPLPEAEPR